MPHDTIRCWSWEVTAINSSTLSMFQNSASEMVSAAPVPQVQKPADQIFSLCLVKAPPDILKIVKIHAAVPRRDGTGQEFAGGRCLLGRELQAAASGNSRVEKTGFPGVGAVHQLLKGHGIFPPHCHLFHYTAFFDNWKSPHAKHFLLDSGAAT